MAPALLAPPAPGSLSKSRSCVSRGVDGSGRNWPASEALLEGGNRVLVRCLSSGSSLIGCSTPVNNNWANSLRHELGPALAPACTVSRSSPALPPTNAGCNTGLGRKARRVPVGAGAPDRGATGGTAGGATSSTAPAPPPMSPITTGGLRSASRLSPVSVMEGVTTEFQAANTQNVKTISQLARSTRVSGATEEVSDSAMDEDEFLRRHEALEQTLQSAKSTHDDFVVLSPEQAAARQKQLEEERAAASGKRLVKPMSKKDLHALKYVRRIEPPLPPLMRSPDSEIPPKEIPDQRLVESNTTPEILDKWYPNARRVVIAARGAERDARIKEVRAQCRQRKTQALDHKRADGMRYSGLAGKPQEEEEDPNDGRAEKWLGVVVAIGFAARLNEEFKVRRMDREERLKYVTDKFNSARLQRMAPRGGYLEQNVRLGACMMDEQFASRALLFADLARAKVKKKHMRNNAHMVAKCLLEWRHAGRLIVQLMRFVARIRRMQAWWRACVQRTRDAVDRVSKQWVKLERADLAREIRLEEQQARAKDKKVLDVFSFSLDERINMRMVSEENRLTFLRHELKARRFKLVPSVTIYLQQLAAWRKRMEEWRETRDAMKLLAGSRSKIDSEVFMLPPGRPTYMPTDDEIMDMLARARKHRNGGGWQVPEFLKPRDAPKTSAKKKEEDGEDFQPEESVNELADAAMLRSLGLDPRELPGFHGQKPEGRLDHVGPLKNLSPIPTPRPMNQL